MLNTSFQQLLEMQGSTYFLGVGAICFDKVWMQSVLSWSSFLSMSSSFSWFWSFLVKSEKLGVLFKCFRISTPALKILCWRLPKKKARKLVKIVNLARLKKLIGCQQHTGEKSGFKQRCHVKSLQRLSSMVKSRPCLSLTELGRSPFFWSTKSYRQS